jgi:hypothetical protein
VDAKSEHITIGISRPTWADATHIAVEMWHESRSDEQFVANRVSQGWTDAMVQHAKSEPGLRAGLPPRYHRVWSSQSHDQWVGVLGSLAEAMFGGQCGVDPATDLARLSFVDRLRAEMERRLTELRMEKSSALSPDGYEPGPSDSGPVQGFHARIAHRLSRFLPITMLVRSEREHKMEYLGSATNPDEISLDPSRGDCHWSTTCLFVLASVGAYAFMYKSKKTVSRSKVKHRSKKPSEREGEIKYFRKYNAERAECGVVQKDPIPLYYTHQSPRTSVLVCRLSSTHLNLLSAALSPPSLLTPPPIFSNRCSRAGAPTA